ncbi:MULTISPECIES: TraM recognition domain-containing protein [Burkholderia cepacia complex]|uniref:TraM recognition domain-containing protein n=1 Tax=Burkholderia cepacia complex TaxID=87882 RepID=UPI001592BB96|nr:MULTISPECIES: type IV secretory system conjugative DNA transfer family protein [Burkholderia cepacia complex]
MSITAALDTTREIDGVPNKKGLRQKLAEGFSNLKSKFSKTPIAKGVDEYPVNYKNGMLVLDGKGPLPWEVRKILDLVVSPETVKNFNYFENQKPEIFAKTILNLFAGAEHKANSVWMNAGESLLFYGMVFHQALVKYKGISNSPAAHIQTIFDMAKPSQMVAYLDENDEPQEKYSHPILDQFAEGQAKIDLMKDGTILNDALKKYIRFNELADETKNSVVFNVESWLMIFLQSEYLRPWANSETSDFNLSDILMGAKIGIALEESKYGSAGLAIQSLAKARLYNEIKNRGNNALERGYSRVFLFVDECQRFLDEMDLAILPEARSLELVCWFASQNIDSIYEKYGKDGGGKFMGAFASIFSFKSTEATYAYVQHKIGKARVIEKVGGNSIIDFEKNAQLQMGTPWFDTTNPQRKKLKAFSFSELDGFFHRNTVARVRKVESDPKNPMYNRTNRSGEMPCGASIQLSKEPQHIFNENCIQELETPFTAIGIAQRGMVTRRSIYEAVAYNDDFQEIDNSIESANEIINKAQHMAHKEAA